MMVEELNPYDNSFIFIYFWLKRLELLDMEAIFYISSLPARHALTKSRKRQLPFFCSMTCQLLFYAAELKKQKLSEIKAGLDDADTLV